MEIVHSTDDTAIAYERTGTGPLLILVPGVFNDHQRLQSVANLMASNYTVITYDRRARGASGDNSPYELSREIDDLDALIALGEGPALVFGYSSGGLLALLAAARGSRIAKLAAYEPPYLTENEGHRPVDLPEQLIKLVAENRRGDAVELFQTKVIGLPAEVVSQIRQSPTWPALEALAPSTVYDALLTQRDTVTGDALASISVPTLVLSGAETWGKLTQSADDVAKAMNTAQRRVLEGGSGHDLDTTPLEPALREFFQ